MSKTLNEKIKESKLKENQIQFLTYQILKGLNYLHSCNIIHRVNFILIFKIFNKRLFLFKKDLKPSNITVNENNELKVKNRKMLLKNKETN